MGLVFLLTSILLIQNAYGWDSEQLEVFDVVEEVKENFYTFMNISQDANEKEIKSAFRGLTLKLHPDKNPGVDTSVQFRNLVSVYEVLRSPTKRKYYHEVLVNGLPNWRSAVYYYRYVRKMGITEACIILFIIVTIGQYLVKWASYFEKKYTIEQNRKTRRKRSEKPEPMIILPKPSITDTLPVQIPRLLWYIVVSLPQTAKILRQSLTDQIKEATKPQPLPEPEEIPIRPKTIRKRNKGFILPEGPSFQTKQLAVNPRADIQVPTNTTGGGGLWTDDDLTELIRLVKKFPTGTTSRWEVIAETMGRAVHEVTHMANKMKENCYRLPSEQEEEPIPAKVKVKTKKEEMVGEDQMKKWSQSQQKAFEEALAKYPKGCTERWDRIAECVPNKSKEECIVRFRFLAGVVKKQKENETE